MAEKKLLNNNCYNLFGWVTPDIRKQVCCYTVAVSFYLSKEEEITISSGETALRADKILADYLFLNPTFQLQLLTKTRFEEVLREQLRKYGEAGCDIPPESIESYYRLLQAANDWLSKHIIFEWK